MLMQMRKELASLCGVAGRKKKCAGEKKPCKTCVIKGKWLGLHCAADLGQEACRNRLQFGLEWVKIGPTKMGLIGLGP